MKLIFAILTIAFSSSAFADGLVLLERRDNDGMGRVTQDTLIYADGTVTRAAGGGTPQTVATLTVPVLAQAEQTVASLQAAELVRTDPSQGYNPSGFVSTYFAVSASTGSSIVFDEFDSGVNFGLPNGAGADLKTLLDEFAQ